MSDSDSADGKQRTDYEDAQRALETREKLENTFQLNGQEYPLKVQEPTLGELDDIEAGLGDDADEETVIREVIDRYLLEPEIDPDAMGVSKLRPLFEGMQEAFQNGEAISNAEAEMPLDEGN